MPPPQLILQTRPAALRIFSNHRDTSSPRCWTRTQTKNTTQPHLLATSRSQEQHIRFVQTDTGVHYVTQPCTTCLPDEHTIERLARHRFRFWVERTMLTDDPIRTRTGRQSWRAGDRYERQRGRRTPPQARLWRSAALVGAKTSEEPVRWVLFHVVCGMQWSWRPPEEARIVPPAKKPPWLLRR